jgi:hypothetical protein
MQTKPNTKLRDLLKTTPVKTRKLSEFSNTEQNRLAKLNAMLDELRKVEIMVRAGSNVFLFPAPTTSHLQAITIRCHIRESCQ